MDGVVDTAASSDGKLPRSRRRTAARPDLYASQIRLAVLLMLCFAVLPGALLISVGILVLVFGHQAHDIVFGVMVLSLTATFVAGITATFMYVRRSTSLARLQTEFVQKVSHDLRTPLTSIRMFVETLQDGRLTDQAKIHECFDVLGEETDRLTAMVERLLRWASMEAGRRAFKPLRVDPSVVVHEAIEALHAQIKILHLEEKTQLKVDVPDGLPKIEVDVDAMSEALLNLLQNALRYTGEHKQLGVRVARGVDREVIITISDNGPGIAKHEQRKIFEQFYRVVDPANPNVEGTGLGLAIVHQVVRAHGGRIFVESDIGKGAAFHIHLPEA
jgi:two-component system, OmpR family, phosphate regulon sensor histidine kinase PhoR